VIPLCSKYFVDHVVVAKQFELIGPLAAVVIIATLVQASTDFALSQVLGLAAQRAVTDMRRRIQAHVIRLPVSQFDSTKTGVLISRIMNDADGLRNLIGTGLVQLLGGLITATAAMGILFWLSWRITAVMVLSKIGFRSPT
jgi:subfamily B ATP-binding cassette protein MsbA